ncbi:MAG: GNAT family N-acetyltransferase [Nanoarchaeota archaeon]|nr:GNAT family N-acetyltransferase [Nanoarchaeota archaeon]
MACKGCKALYTNKSIPEQSRDRVNPLRDLENCVKCGVLLVSYYPDIVDQTKLIQEATGLEGFIGNLAIVGDFPVGFSWGYRMPIDRTQSVNFPLIRSLFVERGINPEKAFYGAETGVVEQYQGRGIGSALVSKRILEASKSGLEYFTFRTINPQMRKIISDLFSGNSPIELFNDPETQSLWFSWDFKDFNCETAEKKIRGLK